MYSIKYTNKMQCYTIFFNTVNDLHVSGGFSSHHQELKTVHTASGICQACHAATASGSSKASLTYTRCCVYSFELLMMGGETA